MRNCHKKLCGGTKSYPKTACKARRRTNDMKNVSKPMRCLFTGLILALVAFVSVGICYKKVVCRSRVVYQIFDGKFTEPFEVCYLLTSDYTLYKVTSFDEKKVSFKFDDLEEILKGNGHKMSDVIIIIHNHLPQTSRSFSPRDIQSWYNFKAMGFTGNYYLRYNGNKIIYELIEDKDDS